jgi:hypothetical protein
MKTLSPSTTDGAMPLRRYMYLCFHFRRRKENKEEEEEEEKVFTSGRR